MKTIRLVLMLTFLIPGRAAFAQKVTVDFDATVDFTKYKTFAWKAGLNSGNPVSDERIRTAVERELGARGLRRAVDAAPDCFVIFFAAATSELSLSTYYDTLGNDWATTWGTSAKLVTSGGVQRKGTLIVDLWDATGKRLLWRGKGQDTISEQPDKNVRKIQNVTAKMFKKFPSGKK